MFPKNINILSWNYDFQIQRAASEYKQEHSHHGEGAYMKRSPLIEYYPPIGNHFPLSTPDYDLNEFRLVHLNGIAGFFHKEDIHHIENFFNNTDSIVSAMNSMIDSPEKFKHLLTFAFETQQGRTGIGRRIEVAKSAAMDTTTIVIIGYSFPFFNSEVDKTIFEVLKESGKLKTIYVQDPSMDVKKIYRQFNLDSSTVEIEAIKSTESFFIPPEFSPIYIFD
jgi:hypothetical protein